ncbi:hypothetical protein [Streptomyces sp. 049-1]|uniref:hypothetical protein n=1 Tax=Streptomyces sp. 049-1 TaxID=2789264 RepID=UPI003980F191
MTGTSSSVRPAVPFGEVLLPAFVDLLSTGSGSWINTGLVVTLPEAGVYEISATLHTVIATNPSSGPYNIAIAGRLFNVTANGAIAGSQYTAQQTASNAAPANYTSDADFGSFHKFVTVTAPTTIRLEVARIDTGGTPVATTGLQTANTRLGFKKISN